MQEGKILVHFENNILKTINFHWNNDIPLDSVNRFSLSVFKPLLDRPTAVSELEKQGARELALRFTFIHSFVRFFLIFNFYWGDSNNNSTRFELQCSCGRIMMLFISVAWLFFFLFTCSILLWNGRRWLRQQTHGIWRAPYRKKWRAKAESKGYGTAWLCI